MANYRVSKGNVGPWTQGTVITDEDLKANPGLGGTRRLRDQLGVIEDTTDEPQSDANALAPENTTGNPDRISKAAAENFRAEHGVDEQGHADPNAKGRRGPAGRS